MGGKIHLRITEDLTKRIKKASTILFFLDYDGTLVPIKKAPHLALLKKSTRKLLKKLSLKKWARIFIVSGRTLANVRELVKLKTISYVGNHGFELYDPRLVFFNKKADESKKAISLIYRRLKRSLRIKGAIVENKYYTLSVHYRLVEKRLVDNLKEKLYNVAGSFQKSGKIRITEGKKVIEIRPNIFWNKGTMVKWLMRRLSLKDPLIIYIGDDKTDEDAFLALKKKALTVLVAKHTKPTAAKYVVSTPGEVINFLKQVKRVKDAG